MNMHVLVLLLGIVMIASTISISSSEAILPEAESLSVIENFDGSSDKFVPGQIVVGLKNTDPYFSPKVTAHGGQVIKTIESLNAFVIKVPVHAEEKFISSISKNPNIKYAERDVVVNALYTPNDQYFNIQWGMQRIGMESVWDVNRNLGAGIIVAVIDTGIYDNHPDFAGTTILTDIDYDFVDDDTDTRPTAICLIPGVGKFAESHSTFVSGIIAATKDNSKGVSGLAPVDILPIRVLGTCGSGYTSDVAAGIRYAADNGADVINLSLGSSVATQVELDAVNYAHAAGVVLVAAAGNDGDGDNLPSYPASYANVISVSAVANDNSFAPYSQHVSSNELAAPGGTTGSCSTSGTTYIVSTGVVTQGNSVKFTYTCGTGTSFAAPHVSGVAALIKASIPGITNDGIRLHLQDNAEDLGAPGRDEFFGYGLVTATSVIAFIEEPPPDNSPTANAGPDATVNESSPVILDGSGSSDPNLDPITFAWTQVSGTAVTLIGDTTVSPTFTSPSVVEVETLEFSLIVNDGTDSSPADNVIITVSNNVNEAPTANAGPDATVNESSPVILDGSGSSDPNGDTLTFLWTAPAGISLSSTTAESPTFTTPSVTTDTVLTFSLIVNDGTDSSPADNVIITVSNNDAPVADIQSVSTDEDTALSIILTATDADGDSLTYTTVSSPSNGSLSGTAPNLTYTPDPDFNGDDFFTFKANDGIADSDPATISIAVVPVNDKPIADDQSVSTDENTELQITLTATDADGDSLTYTTVSSPSNGSLSGTAPNLTYTPDPDFNGDDFFTFKANDGIADSDPATISITVNAVSQGISITLIDPNTVESGGSVNVTITGTGFDTVNVGVQVSLTGGSGPLKVSNTVVVDSTTITATIITKDGGPPRDRCWDVTVTNPDGTIATLDSVCDFKVIVSSAQQGSSKDK